jgi:phosphoribosylaminoimidazolecarboxamide formyltransferase/IMP cyclohydrolase
MTKKIQSALISVFYKDGLEPIIKELSRLGVTIYSTGGTQKFIEDFDIKVTPVESLTGYPSILGGRVKTLHPSVFGGILGRRDLDSDMKEMAEYNIPEIDLVIVDLYPFEETVAQATSPSFGGGKGEAEKLIVEKIDIGGPSMIRAAAKNFKEVLVVAAKKEYVALEMLLKNQNGTTTLEQRKSFAAKAFETVAHYDVAIAQYFNSIHAEYFLQSAHPLQSMRYGENPHQQGVFFGNLNELFVQLNGKELSYNNLVDVDAAVQLLSEFHFPFEKEIVFAIIKHTNVCGAAVRENIFTAWTDAFAGDPESAFGGVLAANAPIDETTANAINELFFEVLIAPNFDEAAFNILKSKKNRILLQLKTLPIEKQQYRSVLNGVLQQDIDKNNYLEWKEVGGRECTSDEKENLEFANIICKHLKSNAIALVKSKQLLGKGCGQTSRIDALRHAIEKAKQFGFDLHGAVMASDAFFPFDDCIKMGHAEGIEAYIQPGGSIRDGDSITYAQQHHLAMALTGVRHFKH